MSHIYRFMGTRSEDGAWRISNDDVAHITRVLRLAAGDTIEVADGAGRACRGTLEKLSKDKVAVQVKDEWQVDQPRFKVGLAIGALKPAAMDEAMPQIVELGIDVVVCFGQRNVAKFRVGDEQVERWQRIIRASFKQCKRMWLPEVLVMPDIESCLAYFSGWRGYLLDPEASSHILDRVAAEGDEVALVGGEKGLDAEEVAKALAAGFMPVSISAHVLRAVTAASIATFALGHRRALSESRRHP